MTMGYAFISYSSKNQREADAWRDFLHKNGVQTWMAPGDIPAGSKYAQVINQAVRDCSCFVLILTDAAQHSIWVAKEVERAVNYRKPIIPIQLESLVLNDEFSFYISTDQVVAVQKIDEDSDEVNKILRSIELYCGFDSDDNAREIGDRQSETASVENENRGNKVSERSKIIAGLLYFLLGFIGDFYLGYVVQGFIKLVVLIFSFIVIDYQIQAAFPYVRIGLVALVLWSVFDAVMVFLGKKNDAKGNALKTRKDGAGKTGQKK